MNFSFFLCRLSRCIDGRNVAAWLLSEKDGPHSRHAYWRSTHPRDDHWAAHPRLLPYRCRVEGIGHHGEDLGAPPRIGQHMGVLIELDVIRGRWAKSWDVICRDGGVVTGLLCTGVLGAVFAALSISGFSVCRVIA